MSKSFDKKDRLFFECGTHALNLQGVAFNGGNNLSLSINNEWARDSHRGFGEELAINLSRKDALGLRDFLNEWLASADRTEVNDRAPPGRERVR